MTDDVDQLNTQLKFIYDNYRTALLNRKFYGEMLSRYQRYNYWMEIGIAIGATGSAGVGGLAIWGTELGKIGWIVISSASVMLGVIKPIMQMGKQIEKYTKLYTGHANIFLELKAMVEEIEVSRNISRKVEDRYASIGRLIRELGGLEDPKQSRRLILNLQGEVNHEIPAERLWVPRDSR